MRNLRRVAWVATEEVTRYFRGFNRRVLVFIGFAALAASLLVPNLLDRGVVPDEGIYRAEVLPGGALEAPARADRQLEVLPGFGSRVYTGQADIALLDDRTYYADTERGRAAIHDFAEFSERYYDATLRNEENQTAAFPVRIHLVYEGRVLTPDQFQQTNRGFIRGGDYSTINQSVILPQAEVAPAEQIPGTVEPPFPMRSLLLTFVYLIPLNFVGQYYAGSLLAERTRRRGVLLLSAPLTGPQVLLGKSLPYLGFALLFSVAATIFLSAGLLALLSVIPVFGFFLAATCFCALIARSYRELTFLVTTMSVALSTYLFLPAIFTQVHPIAFISPISVVAAGIRGEAVPFTSFLYSITPLTLAALVLTTLAAALYREETLFTPRAITSKVLDAVHLLVQRRHARFLYAGILLIPFVFGAELFVLAFAASLPLEVALVMFLVGVAIVEEIAKAVPSLAHFRRSAEPRPAWIVGALVGFGFFLGEKLSLLFAIVGLDLLPLGRTLLANYGVFSGAIYVLGPIALHAGTAIITAYGARGGRATFGLGLVTSIFVHVVYNWTVIRSVA